jgi:mannose-6-phosphate isomerase-like protein (cupin superfamily)
MEGRMTSHGVTSPDRTQRRLTDAEAKERGVWTEHNSMLNGELRFRLKNTDGTAYIRTESEKGGWQKSHYHKSVRETYIVQSGRIVLAELIDKKVKLRVFGPNEVVTTEPYVVHNVYMFAGSVIHTVKHGMEGQVQDWHGAASFDEQTVHLGENDIVRLAVK